MILHTLIKLIWVSAHPDVNTENWLSEHLHVGRTYERQHSVLRKTHVSVDRTSEWRELPVWFFTTRSITFFSAIYTLWQHLNTIAHIVKKDRRIIFTSESTSPSYLRWRTLHWERRQWQQRRFRCSRRGRGRRGYWSWGRASPSLWPAAGLHAPGAETSVMTRWTQRSQDFKKITEKVAIKKATSD